MINDDELQEQQEIDAHNEQVYEEHQYRDVNDDNTSYWSIYS